MKIKEIICYILGGHFFGFTSYVQVIPPIWGTIKDREEWVNEMQNRDCRICGVTLKRSSKQ